MALPGNDDEVLLKLILDAKQASKELKETLANVKQIEAAIKQLAKSSGASFSQVGGYVKSLYADQLKAADVTKQQGVELRKTFNTQVNQAVKNLNSEIKESTKSGQGFNQVLRLIRGTLVAIGVFRVFQFIEESIRKAEETAKEFETSLYRIANVERIISQAGIETSVEGLRNIIRDIKKDLPIFSEADITQQVSLIGIMTKEFGLTEMQIKEVAKAIGVLNIRSGETEDLLTTTNKVLTALVAPSGRGIASLGLDFSQAALEAKAFETQVLKAGESFSDLTDHEKDMLKIAILLESTGQELETVQKFLETNTGALAEQNAEWEDTLRILGQAVIGVKATFAPFAVEFLKFLQDSINGGKALIIIFQAVENEVRAFAAVLDAFRRDPLGFIKNYEQIGQGLADVFTTTLEDGFNRFFSGQVPEDAPQWFKDLFGEFVDEENEATAATKDFTDAIEDISELEGFDKLINDLDKLQQKLQDIQEDFDIDQARDFEDYQIDINRIIEDYAIKRQRVIDDTNDKIADANKKHRNRELDDEARFQEQLRQLREKFLFNLEDALRERDARQVLRLQRQYQMDKTALENEHALRQEEQDRQHAEDIQRIKDERDERLAELAQEERIRLQREREDFELRQQRAEQDHQLELDRLAEQIDERLMEFARQIGEEYDLNEEGVNALYDLLQQYYGPQGLFDGLYDYSYNSMVARAQQMLAAVNAIVAQASALTQFNPLASSYNVEAIQSIGPQADGGSFLATRPTHALFGEAGPEIAQFIPVRKLRNGGAIGSPSNGGGMNGHILVEMTLSPDLEARVIRNTLSETANVVARVRRTKS